MIDKSLLAELEKLFDEKEKLKSNYQKAEAAFTRERYHLRELIEKGETTGDKILDWTLCGEYPYQKREENAREVCSYLQEHEGDIFLFLDLDYNSSRIWNFHTGKIASPFLSYTPREHLSLVVEEGTLVKKELMNYNPPRLRNPIHERNTFPFIEGLTNEPYKQENGIIQSTHSPFSMDDYHYVLAAGEENVLSYLHERKLIPEATREHFDGILSK